jgi:hypothetical protein
MEKHWSPGVLTIAFSYGVPPHRPSLWLNFVMPMLGQLILSHSWTLIDSSPAELMPLFDIGDYAGTNNKNQ